MAEIKERPLTPKQQRFVEEYAVDLNALQAATRAGYSSKTAGIQGHWLLRNPKVAHAIAEMRAKLTDECEVHTRDILNGLKEVIARCVEGKPKMVWDYKLKCLVPAVDKESGATIFEFDSNGANRALELLGKYKGIWKDKLELSGEAEMMRTYIQDSIEARKATLLNGNHRQ